MPDGIEQSELRRKPTADSDPGKSRLRGGDAFVHSSMSFEETDLRPDIAACSEVAKPKRSGKDPVGQHWIAAASQWLTTRQLTIPHMRVISYSASGRPSDK